LVVGGGGFLGRHIAEYLLKRGEKHVRIFDVRKTFDNDKISFVTGDITKLEDVINACEGITVVFHTAATTHIGHNSDFIHKVNVGGTHNVIKACIQKGVKKLVYTSTSSVIFNGRPLHFADETTPYCAKHFDDYNLTKELAERAVLAVEPSSGLLTCSIRPSGIFGPRDVQGWPGFIEVGKNGKSKLQIGDGSNMFDWTYIDNIVYAHILASDKLVKDSPVVQQAYFITNDEPIPFWDMADYVYTNMGYPRVKYRLPFLLMWYISVLLSFFVWLLSPIVIIHPTFTPIRVANAGVNRTFSVEKAKRDLGYKPIVSVKEGMKRTLEYFKALENHKKQ